jgi:hypothetical protein
MISIYKKEGAVMCYILNEKIGIGCPAYWGKVEVSQVYYEKYKKLLINKEFDVFEGDKYSSMTGLALRGYKITDELYEEYIAAPYNDMMKVIEPYKVRSREEMVVHLRVQEPLCLVTEERRYERDFEFAGYGEKGYYLVSEGFRELLCDMGLEKNWIFVNINIINKKTKNSITLKKYYLGLAFEIERIPNGIIDMKNSIFQYEGQKGKVIGTFDEVDAIYQDEKRRKKVRVGVVPDFYTVKFTEKPNASHLFTFEKSLRNGVIDSSLFCSEKFSDEIRRREFKGIEALPLMELRSIGLIRVGRQMF